jgi:hypothetical protein
MYIDKVGCACQSDGVYPVQKDVLLTVLATFGPRSKIRDEQKIHNGNF